MANLLVRDIPENVVAALDARAGRLGLSRSEYLRRRLAQEAMMLEGSVSTDDLVQFSQAFADLANQEVMGQAWE
ncbi:MAG: type II toxin-antitoxin system VapB family antitoxin [Acidimicrobiales bacterium]